MTYQQSRILAKNIHILVAVYQFIYIYGPLHHWQHGLTVVQFITFPLLFLTGLWLRKGQKIWINYLHQPA